jgi:iron complex transport system permease protein
VSIEQTWPASLETILFQIRLPRVVLAGVVGAVLALAGATYQAVFRNPLADPYLIGVAGGAGLGATIAMLFPIGLLLGILSPVPLFAFAGALLAVLAAYVLARSGRTVPSATLILAGIAIASFASANTSFLMLISGERIQSIFAWILGGFTVANWNQVMVVVPYVTIPVVFILLSTRILDALQLDEEQARQMGVPVERAKLLLLAAASLATAGAVAVSGLIGFVGLIVPHAVRLLVGPGQRLVLPVSALAGAAFLILCDLIARAAFGPVEIPVGIVTAFCGAPFFLYLLRRRRSMIRP